MRSYFRWAVGLVAFAGLGTPAYADPILLGQWNISAGSASQGMAYVDFRTVTSLTFALGYDLPGSPIPEPLGVCVGCERLPLNDVVPGSVFDFNASNSQAFGSFVARVTDGTSELLWSLSYIHNSDPTWVGGGGGGNYDTELFPTASTWDVAFVRLIVTDLSLAPYSSPCLECPGLGYDYRTTLSWQIWGTGDASRPYPPSSPARVPEVSPLAFTAVGLIVAFVRDRRRSMQRGLAVRRLDDDAPGTVL